MVLRMNIDLSESGNGEICEEEVAQWEVLGAPQPLSMTAWERCGVCIFLVNLFYICYKVKRKKEGREKLCFSSFTISYNRKKSLSFESMYKIDIGAGLLVRNVVSENCCTCLS